MKELEVREKWNSPEYIRFPIDLGFLLVVPGAEVTKRVVDVPDLGDVFGLSCGVVCVSDGDVLELGKEAICGEGDDDKDDEDDDIMEGGGCDFIGDDDKGDEGGDAGRRDFFANEGDRGGGGGGFVGRCDILTRNVEEVGGNGGGTGGGNGGGGGGDVDVLRPGDVGAE